MATPQPAVVAALFERAAMTPRVDALIGFLRDGELQRLTWGELAQRVASWSRALRACGVCPGDRVGGLLDHGTAWAEIFLASITVGAIAALIEPSRATRRLAQCLRDSSPTVVFVSAGAQQAKYERIRPELTFPHRVWVLDDREPRDPAPGFPADFHGVLPQPPAISTQHIGAGRTATIVYTSGTTRTALGVTLSHANLLAPYPRGSMSAKSSSLVVLCLTGTGGLASITTLVRAIFTGFCIAVRDPEGTLDPIEHLRPHVIVSVPAVFERIMKDFAPESGTHSETLRNRLGGRVAYCTSMGAPLSAAVRAFFAANGIVLRNAYGMTETAGVICPELSTRADEAPAGPAVPGFEIRIAADGEIQLKGPQVMNGYWANDEATCTAVSADGWLKTGDLGALDPDRNLILLGRKKDLLVGCDGENVAASEIEGMLTADPFIDQACVYGESRPFLTAVVVPRRSSLEAWARVTGLQHGSYEALLQTDEVKSLYKSRVSRLLHQLDPFEQVHDLILAPHVFTTENELLTTTLKTRREAVVAQYRPELDRLYDRADPGPGITHTSR